MARNNYFCEDHFSRCSCLFQQLNDNFNLLKRDIRSQALSAANESIDFEASLLNRELFRNAVYKGKIQESMSPLAPIGKRVMNRDSSLLNCMVCEELLVRYVRQWAFSPANPNKEFASRCCNSLHEVLVNQLGIARYAPLGEVPANGKFKLAKNPLMTDWCYTRLTDAWLSSAFLDLGLGSTAFFSMDRLCAIFTNIVILNRFCKHVLNCDEPIFLVAWPNVISFSKLKDNGLNRIDIADFFGYVPKVVVNKSALDQLGKIKRCAPFIENILSFLRDCGVLVGSAVVAEKALTLSLKSLMKEGFSSGQLVGYGIGFAAAVVYAGVVSSSKEFVSGDFDYLVCLTIALAAGSGLAFDVMHLDECQTGIVCNEVPVDIIGFFQKGTFCAAGWPVAVSKGVGITARNFETDSFSDVYKSLLGFKIIPSKGRLDMSNYPQLESFPSIIVRKFVPKKDGNGVEAYAYPFFSQDVDSACFANVAANKDQENFSFLLERSQAYFKGFPTTAQKEALDGI